MIKICSLDFINKDKFETDVLAENGNVLASGGDFVTPELLLKLYYKTIYVKDEIKEKITETICEVEETIPEQEAIVAQAVSESEIEASPEIEEVATKQEELTEQIVSEAAVEAPTEAEETVVEQEAIVEQIISKPDAEVLPEIEETVAKQEAVIIEPSLSESVQIATSESVTVSEPLAKEIQETKQAGPRAASEQEIAANEHIDGTLVEKGPRQVESSFIPHETEQTDSTKGPRIVDLGEPAKEEERKIYQQMQQPKIEEEKPEVVEIKPEDMPLEFNEDEAKKIVENSVKIGKMLNFSQKELKELEQVAYYSNIGINKFKRKDVLKKSFRKMKALASYQKIIEEGLISEDLAEIVKYTANTYDSDAFPLNSKIPYHQIVAISGYYEDELLKGAAKEDVLLKMLQLGGNQFNVFVLHKFINLMREK